jgi:hypothetical protein
VYITGAVAQPETLLTLVWAAALMLHWSIGGPQKTLTWNA